MLERRSLKAPIALGVVMIVLVVVLAAVWVLANLLGVSAGHPGSNSLFWVFLAIGSVLLAAVLAGVIAYLTLTVKAFNLNRRQSNFIDSVTHELKSPIASLKLYLQTMSRRAVDEQQRRDFHRFMLEDVERLDALINHLLDAARIERGVEADNDELVRLDELLSQCASATCIRYRLPAQTVVVDAPPTTLRSQLVQLEILFRNLIDNAVKYGGSPPEVVVRAEPMEDGRIVISITDNGAGIPVDQRRKVFGRFVRLGSELERSTPGTGLGLYLVRNATKAMRGSIRILPGDDQQGTRFEVTLPGVVGSPAASSSGHLASS